MFFLIKFAFLFAFLYEACARCSCKLDEPSQDLFNDDPYTSVRLEVLEDTLQKLSEKLASLKALGKTQVKAETEKYLQYQKDLLVRVAQLEGSKCDEQHFWCDGRCILNLLVCDGSQDCRDGADEAADVCRLPISTGAIFQTEHFREGNCPSPQISALRITIVSAKRLPYLLSKVKINTTSTVWIDVGSHVITDAVSGYGTYDFVQRRFVLYAEKFHGLVLQCTFDGVNSDICQGQVVNQGSNEHCALFTLQRYHSKFRGGNGIYLNDKK